MRRVWMFVVIGAVVAAACEKQGEKVNTAAPGPPAVSTPQPLPAPAERKQSFSVENIKRGGELYRELCLQCHGPEGQGHPDWQTPSDGIFTAAPPLNGTGNTWKRNKQGMLAIIRDGTIRDGVPAMPAYKNRLRDEHIESVIIWFQVLWPPEVYERWLNANIDASPSEG